VADLLPPVWAALGGTAAELDRLRVTGPAATLRSTFPVTAVGAAAVGASLLAGTLGTAAPVGLDTRGLAVALRSERYVRLDGRSLGNAFDPLSAFHRTADGWLRLHVNYPWHRAAALRVLGCAEEEGRARPTTPAASPQPYAPRTPGGPPRAHHPRSSSTAWSAPPRPGPLADPGCST
jgi:hypothetical protein